MFTRRHKGCSAPLRGTGSRAAFKGRAFGVNILRSTTLRSFLLRFWHLVRVWAPRLLVLVLLYLLVTVITPARFGPLQARFSGSAACPIWDFMLYLVLRAVR